MSHFLGPCEIDDSNFGLYASSDLQLFIFYFRDINRDLQLNYYKRQAMNPSENEQFQHLMINFDSKIVKIIKAPEGTLLSQHSPNFKRLIGIGDLDKIEVHDYYKPI